MNAQAKVCRGHLISFEGMDGAGKSSHIHRTAQWLGEQGVSVVITREPGGTEVSEHIRELVIHTDMHLKTEALLMYAGRVQHIEEKIKPALAQGVWVITDRFEDSSFAYQASAGGLGFESLNALSHWALSGFEPNLTLLFDLPVDESLARIDRRNSTSDKFEAKPRAYLDAVRDGFLRRAQQAPGRVQRIDATVNEQQVWAQVQAVLQRFLRADRSPNGGAL